MNWNTNQTWPNNLNKGDKPWPNPNTVTPPSLNPLDQLSQDQLLLLWHDKKQAIEYAKNEEIEMRKYIVSRAFPEKQEGTSNIDLGNGYTLKAVIKYNYNLDNDNAKIQEALNQISKIGNEGKFIADRLVSWKPNFLKSEYNNILEAAENDSNSAKEMLKIIGTVLTITDAAPTLTITEPKAKKK